MNRPGTLAEHQYFVALYTLRIVTYLKGAIGHPTIVDLRTDRMVAHALVHDFDEIITGDMPSPTKIALKKDKEAWKTFSGWVKDTLYKMLPWVVELQDDLCLTAEETTIVKFVDFLEAGIKLKEDAIRGNRQVEPHFDYIEQAMLASLEKSTLDVTMNEALVAIWEDSIRRIEMPEEIKVVGTF
jgi:5'-deoxynucleotidase YfbR-like HD superfamily hydrolase